MRGVSLRVDGLTILDGIDWTVRRGECWVVLGANGSGKTTLLRMVALARGPSRGELRVLGAAYGRSDVRSVRPRIGFVSAATLQSLRPSLDVAAVVMTAKHGALEPWWHRYDDEDRARAMSLLSVVGCDGLADRAVGACSQGERQRVLLARALMADPSVLVLDEPCAGLDLAGRESLLAVVDALSEDAGGPTILMSTHHLEEIPRGATHALVLRGGRVMMADRIDVALTSAVVSDAFDLGVEVTRVDGRWASRAR